MTNVFNILRVRYLFYSLQIIKEPHVNQRPTRGGIRLPGRVDISDATFHVAQVAKETHRGCVSSFGVYHCRSKGEFQECLVAKKELTSSSGFYVKYTICKFQLVQESIKCIIIL